MAGVYSCLASSPISFPSLSPPSPLPFKSTTKISRLNSCCFPATSRSHHGPKQYPCHRISTRMTRRLEAVVPLKILRAKSRCNSSNINSPSSESTNDSSSKDDGKNWISRVQKIALDVVKPYREPWVVPWGVKTAFLFWCISCAWENWHRLKILPLIKCADEAYHDPLWNISREPVRIVILYLCLYRFRPLPPDCLHFSVKGNWMLGFIVACLFLPLVRHLDLITYLPMERISSLEQAIKFRDYPAVMLDVLASTVCAPICEEIEFRGFLIPLLLRYMPLHWSIILSSVYFAAMHNSPSVMLGNTFFGTIVGALFAGSRNLLPPVLLHMAYNMYCFFEHIRYFIGTFLERLNKISTQVPYKYALIVYMEELVDMLIVCFRRIVLVVKLMRMGTCSRTANSMILLDIFEFQCNQQRLQ